MREINVSRAGDPVHAEDKALTRETPAKRGRVNRHASTDSVVLLLVIFCSSLSLFVMAMFSTISC